MRVALILLLSSCGGADEEESAGSECERVRDRLIQLKLADASGVDEQAHRNAMKTALGDDFLEQCNTALSSAERDCVLNATDAATAQACAASNR